MSANHTENYGLCQWEATDQVLRADFNEDNAKIDTALGTLAAGQLRIHTGHYMGEGKGEKTIELPFKPMFFWLQRVENDEMRLMIFGDKTARVSQWGGVPTSMPNGQGAVIHIEEDKIRMEGLLSLTANERATFAMNANGYNYYYMALG